ncbi:Tyr recombinase domain-containing protein [Acetobacteraceae bacterium EV16G]|uniref:Tyr recombinase domain-containing protein n=1 Tax=Sorlinia euscelidii TaxID=3081148 RepID=A0ABU7U462_9PROT
MHLFKQSNSDFWFVSFVHALSGKRVRRSTKEKTQGAARKAALRIVQEFEEGPRKRRTRLNEGLTLRQALTQYLRWLKAEGKPSLRMAEGLARKTLGELKPARFALKAALPIVQLSPAHIEELVMARREEGNAPQTIAHEIKMIRAAVNYAAALGHVYPPKMDLRGRAGNAWRMPSVKPKTRYLSREEWMQVYDHLNPLRPVHVTRQCGYAYELPLEMRTIIARQMVQDLFVVITLTGGRWSEVARLTWDRVDTAGFAWVRLWGSKTDKERILPLPEMARKVLQRRFEARQSIMVFPGRNETDFCSAVPARAIIQAMEAVGLNRPDIVEMHGKATVHSLRHTFASWLLQGGADLSEVQEGLGHTTLDMTRRYAHLSKSRSAERIASALNAVIPL